MTQITEEVRDQLLEASAATRKAYNTYRREADPEEHYSAGEGAQAAADKSKDELEMSAVISIMQPILRFLQLLCENHNRDLQVGAGALGIWGSAVGLGLGEGWDLPQFGPKMLWHQRLRASVSPCAVHHPLRIIWGCGTEACRLQGWSQP